MIAFRVTGIDDGFLGGVKRDVSYKGDTVYNGAIRFYSRPDLWQNKGDIFLPQPLLTPE